MFLSERKYSNIQQGVTNCQWENLKVSIGGADIKEEPEKNRKC